MLQTLDHLSPSQLQAVTHGGGPLLIHGPAGTGKTHCLTARTHRLAQADPAAGSSLLLLALSESAAAELRIRLEALVGEEDCCEPEILTAPELCESLLRAEALEASLDPFFVMATRADRVALLLERLEDLPLGGHDFQGRPARLMASLVERIDALKQDLIDAERFMVSARRLARERPGAESTRELDFAQLYLEHDRLLAERATPDPGELLIRACALLRERPSIRRRLAERFSHVLVDDFQDCSPAVAALVELLAAEHRQLTLAADPHRLGPAADPDGIGALERFRAQHPDGLVVELTGNFRSVTAIATAAAAVLGEEETGRNVSRGQGGEGAVDAPQRGGPRGRAHAGASSPNANTTTPPDVSRQDTFVTSAQPPASQPADDGDGQPTAPRHQVAEAVEFWRPANERAQAQGVAADVQRLIVAERMEPQRIAILLGSPDADSQAIVGALEERAIAHRVMGSTILFERAEVRDVLAWMRLLIDPRDSPAVLRVLARAPIELRQVDLVRVVQIARRRKLDTVTALAAAIESPQIPPEARERIQGFLRLHRETAAELDTIRPDLFVHRLIERIGLRRQRLFAAQTDVVEGLIALARLGELAGAFVRRAPQAGSREFAEYLAATSEAGLDVQDVISEPRPGAVQVMGIPWARGREFEHVYVLGLDVPAPLLHLAVSRARRRVVLSTPAGVREGLRRRPAQPVERARVALGADWIEREEELFGPAETLHGTLRLTREQLLSDVARVAGRLGELRLDTELDVAHGVVRYLELLKLAALLERPSEQTVAEVLPDINSRLLSASTSLQGEILRSSTLDEDLLAVEHERRPMAARASGPGAGEPSLAPFLPRRGDGLVLSASDIETYRGCPLRYKFARVFRIPSESTLNQRFGIVIHQVLERYHATDSATLSQMLELLDAGWRRSGLGDGEQERQLLRKARSSLTRYHERLREQRSEPVWFERSFSFRLGPHQIRGRVDRVDRLAEGEGYELIDYKTGLPRSVHQLRQDIQLSLYALAAREAWQLEASRQAYYYVLDDQKVQLPRDDREADWISETVLEVGEAILSQEFEPTPSVATCSMCDYRIMCPAAET